MFYPVLYNYYARLFKGFYYTVQVEENIEKISKRYKIPVHNIIRANNLTYPYILKEGDRLFIPGMDEPIASGGVVIHTVMFGENIDIIALKYGLRPEKIMEKNYLNNKSMIFIGQKLLIPEKGEYTQGEEISQRHDTEKKNIDEIRVFPFSPNIPKPGSTDYDSIKNISRKFSILKKGNRGNDVLKFQRLALAIGYKIRRMNGDFDSELESIVRNIQKKAGFTETGIIDEKVWEQVFSIVNSMPGMMR